MLEKRILRTLIKRINWSWQVLRHGKISKEKTTVFLPLAEEDLQEIYSVYPMPKFFIFGHARSGTTLLSRLIGLHPEIHTSRLGHFFTYRSGVFTLFDNPFAQNWVQRPSKYWNDGKNLSVKLMRSVCDFILEKEAKKFGKVIVGDKSNNNIVNGEAVKRLKLIYPDAKLIYLVRDGRDTILSQRFRFFIDLPKYLDKSGLSIREQLANNPAPFVEGDKSIFTEKGLRKAAVNWAENVIETHRLGKELFGSRYLSLKFEDLISEPEKTLQGIWRFLEADDNYSQAEREILEELEKNPDEQWQKKQSSQIIKNLEKGKSGSWQKLFNQKDKKLFKAEAGKVLINWGYEKDMDW